MSEEIIRQRKEIIQNVIDRLIQHGDKYLNDLISLNEKYPTKFEKSGTKIIEKK
jgi:hypothetical protein